MTTALKLNNNYADYNDSSALQRNESRPKKVKDSGVSLGRILKAGVLGALALSGGTVSARVQPNDRKDFRDNFGNDYRGLERMLAEKNGDFTALNNWADNHNVTAAALRKATGKDDLAAASAEAQSQCTIDDATVSAGTSEGTFYACGDDFKGSVGFLPKADNGDSLASNQAVVLANISDDRVDSYGTRDALTGNRCKHVSSVVGKNCFSKIAGTIADNLVPRIRPSAPQSEIVDEINRFKPRELAYTGEPSMCFENTGQFHLSGVNPQDAVNALAQRKSAYAGCENSEGDNRVWASTAWTNAALFPGMFVGAGLSAVAVGGFAVAVGVLGCCLNVCSRP